METYGQISRQNRYYTEVLKQDLRIDFNVVNYKQSIGKTKKKNGFYYKKEEVMRRFALIAGQISSNRIRRLIHAICQVTANNWQIPSIINSRYLE